MISEEGVTGSKVKTIYSEVNRSLGWLHRESKTTEIYICSYKRELMLLEVQIPLVSSLQSLSG